MGFPPLLGHSSPQPRQKTRVQTLPMNYLWCADGCDGSRRETWCLSNQSLMPCSAAFHTLTPPS